MSDSSDTMECHDIKIGMVFHSPNYYTSEIQNEAWVVVDHGNYKMENGEKVSIENQRLNLWHCRRVGTDEKPILMCFDQVFLKTKHDFRMP